MSQIKETDYAKPFLTCFNPINPVFCSGLRWPSGQGKKKAAIKKPPSE
jgi:hypothetical protein